MVTAAPEAASRRVRRALARLRLRATELRFWVIQSLVLGVTVVHGAVEYAESRGGPVGFLDGLHYFPVEAYILPVVIAGWWYGFEGGVLTGLFAMVLSGPNLVLFHAGEFAWLGEFAASAFVVAVGMVVAYMVQREARAKAAAEETSRRLEALHGITSVLNRHDEPRRMVAAVLGRLDTLGGVRAAAFVPEGGSVAGGPVITGEPQARARIGRAIGGPGAHGPGASTEGPLQAGGLARTEVATSNTALGTLLVDCGDDDPCSGDTAMLAHVAHELAYALENAQMHERNRAHLQGYARAVTVAQEKERKRLARDLHDGAAQSLIVLSRGLGQLAQGNGAQTAETATRLQEVAKQILRSIRRTTWALRPALLDDLGLLPAIDSIVDHQNQRGGATIEVRLHGEPRRLDHDVELAAFRIVQEALSNVERHSDAETATVTVEFGDDMVAVSVVDDGTGFDVEGHRENGSFGLTGMQERAELVDGLVTVESVTGEGTTVMLTVTG